LGWAWPWDWEAAAAEEGAGPAVRRRNGADSAAESMDPRPNSPATKRWSEESALVVATGSSGT